jgi:hypothetical protein
MCCRVRGMLEGWLVWLLRWRSYDGYALTIVGSKAPYALGAGVHDVQYVSDVVSITSSLSDPSQPMLIPSRPRWMGLSTESRRGREPSRALPVTATRKAHYLYLPALLESLFSFLLFNLTALLIINGF